MLKSVINDLIGSYNAYKDREKVYRIALSEKAEEIETCLSELFDEVPLDPFEITLNGRKYVVSKHGIEGLLVTFDDYNNFEIVLCEKLKEYIADYQSKYVSQSV